MAGGQSVSVYETLQATDLAASGELISGGASIQPAIAYTTQLLHLQASL
jgi:hypothetical protein